MSNLVKLVSLEKTKNNLYENVDAIKWSNSFVKKLSFAINQDQLIFTSLVSELYITQHSRGGN